MAEWRIKQYYESRVLISVDDVLESSFPESLICLTGAEMNMLRNLTQYLHRRATWVSEYRQNDYLAPTNEEWDLLDAAIAALEDKLMGCTELTALLEAIKAATECVCEAANTLASGTWPAGGQVTGQPDYDDYESDVEEDEGDPPDPWATWDAWRVQKCKSSQKLIDDVHDRLVDMNVAVGAGTVLNFAAVMALLIASALVPPIVIVLAIAALLAQIGIAALTTEGTLWLEDNKADIVCLIYVAPTTLAARTDVYEYIDENWDVEGSPMVIKYLLNWWALSSIFDGNMPGYADWESEYTVEACVNCPPLIQGSDWFAWPVTGPDWYREKLTDGDVSWCLIDIDWPERYIQGIIYDVTLSQSGYCPHKTMTRQSEGCSYVSGQMFADSSGIFQPGRFARLNPTEIDEVGCAAYFNATLSTAGVWCPYEHGEGAIHFRAGSGIPIAVQVKWIIFRGTIA